MLSRFVRVQHLGGHRQDQVKLELPAAGGLYRFSNVTNRGVQVGKVTAMDVSRNAATAPGRYLVAAVRSASAEDEQYVGLLPRTNSPPYLQDAP